MEKIKLMKSDLLYVDRNGETDFGNYIISLDENGIYTIQITNS